MCFGSTTGLRVSSKSVLKAPLILSSFVGKFEYGTVVFIDFSSQ